MIEVAGLRKRFGPALALDGMTFTVRPGQVTGFVGPNGAGKSTTMRVILGLDAADAGTALIGGRPYRSPAAARCATSARCWTPRALQPGRTARNHLLWLAHSQGLGGQPGRRGRSSRPAWQRGPPARPAATPWACGSGWASPPRCSATRRC